MPQSTLFRSAFLPKITGGLGEVKGKSDSLSIEDQNAIVEEKKIIAVIIICRLPSEPETIH